MEPNPRDYLTEARAILEGRSILLPERLHLMALELAHAQEMVGLINEIRAKIESMEVVAP